MTLSAGSKIGPYEVLSSLGAGGMGEVIARATADSAEKSQSRSCWRHRCRTRTAGPIAGATRTSGGSPPRAELWNGSPISVPTTGRDRILGTLEIGSSGFLGMAISPHGRTILFSKWVNRERRSHDDRNFR